MHYSRAIEFQHGVRMKSTDLLPYGLQVWHEFTLQSRQILNSILPPVCGVYVMRYRQPFGRFIGESDIVYIGSATQQNRGLSGRILSYFKPGPTQNTNKRILARLQKHDFGLSFVECSDSVSARELERSLLSQYEADHGELPPLNRTSA